MASPSDRETDVYLAKLAEEAERYEDMVEHIKKVVKMHKDLTVDEKVLLSVGYKNVIGPRRASWRVLTSLELKEESRGNEVNTKRIKEYTEKVETEINDICKDAISVVNELLIDPPTDPESSVFYQKMLGDYYRYLAEIKSGSERHVASLEAFTAYEAAIHTAEIELPRPHPIRLGAALNFSVYFYEIVNAPERAREVALKAFDEALPELDTLNEELYKDAEHILHLLRDNLVQWGHGGDENSPSKDGGDGAPSKDGGDDGSPSKDGGDGADQVGRSDVPPTSDD